MVSLADIQAARERIAAHVYLSPCAYTETLSRMTGCRVYLKLENLQMTGSFKERGALNKILSLNAEQKAAGIVAASAGNHAQGVAHAARIQGIKAVIVMPETTPLAKIRGTQAFGAEIILHGGSYDEAFAKASELRIDGAIPSSMRSMIPPSLRARAPSVWSCWNRSRISTCCSSRSVVGA